MNDPDDKVWKLALAAAGLLLFIASLWALAACFGALAADVRRPAHYPPNNRAPTNQPRIDL